jgi:hypothetical protein
MFSDIKENVESVNVFYLDPELTGKDNKVNDDETINQSSEM